MTLFHKRKAVSQGTANSRSDRWIAVKLVGAGMAVPIAALATRAIGHLC